MISDHWLAIIVDHLEAPNSSAPCKNGGWNLIERVSNALRTAHCDKIARQSQENVQIGSRVALGLR